MPQRSSNILLRRARLKNHWDQRYVADSVGVTPLTVGRWERGETFPSIYHQSRLAELFGSSPFQLGFSQLTGDLTETKPQYFDPMIPLSVQPLIGREVIMNDLSQRFAREPTSLCLYGLPGVGKTSVVQTVISSLKTHDGFLWASLGKNPNISEILSRWGALFGITGNADRETLISLLRRVLGSQRFLIILDDVWDYQDANILKVGIHCSYLATTRSPQIALQFAMQGAIHVPELDEDAGVALIEQIAPEITTYEASDKELVRILVKSVGSLPLALVLAGKCLHVQGGYTHQPRRLRKAVRTLLDVRHRLTLTDSAIPEDPHAEHSLTISLQTVIGISDMHLSLHAQGALRALSVFPAKPHNFSEEAALEVSAVSVDVLDELIDSGLMEINAKGRYMFHQTITDYARTSLVDQTPYHRFVTYFAQYVSQQRDFEEIESANILAMLDIAYQMKREELVQATCAMVPFLLIKGLYDLSEQYLGKAYERAKGTGEKEIPLLLLFGQTAQKRGKYPQTVEYFQRGLMLAQQQESAEWMSAFLADLGWVTWKQGHYSEAERYLREGLHLASQIENEERICKFLRVLGAVVSSLGRYTEGQQYLRKGLTIARRIGNREQICVLLIDLGVSFQETLDFTQAEEFSGEGLALARQIGHREWMSLAYFNLTDLSLVMHRYAEAQDYARQGLALAELIGNLEWTSGNLANLGIAAREQGDFFTAQTHFLRARQLAQQQGRPYMIFMITYEYAGLALEQKDWRTAEILLKEIHSLIPEDDQGLSGLWIFGMARVTALQGNLQEARRLGEESRDILNVIQHGSTKKVEQWLSNLPRLHRIDHYEDMPQMGA